MKKSAVVVLHIGFWAVYLGLVLIMIAVYSKSIASGSTQFPRVLNAFNSVCCFVLFPSLITFYSYYFLLFPKYLQQNKIFFSIIYGLLISLGAGISGYVLIRYFIETGRIIDMDQGGKNGRSTFVSVIMVIVFISSIAGIAALIIRGFITWYNEIKLKELLREKNHEMEMALIKSQLDPHLLFNTINNIDALILKDGAKASDYLNQLSDIMRFMLYETKADVIFLAREIEYIKKYIALQKIRTTNKNYVHFSVTGDIGDKLIAPMLFIPFIENAFKHTNNKKFENAITIDIFIRADDIQLRCENKFDPKPEMQRSDSGLGNELIQKRLNLIYPGKHTLEVQKKEGLYSVILTVING
ncbi:MAG TPA: histidine kinase [Mucilaginibacter sp.]|nr:histidine kinase [Mucilaginibacter sp.]